MLLQSSTQVIATERKDYPEWHHGRSKYAVWYIEIDQPEIITYVDEIQAQFADLLIHPNQRQYHISLFICGFLTQLTTIWDDDFSIKQLEQHITLLNQLQLHSFELNISHIDSFSSALFLQVNDPHLQLQQIRQQFKQIHNEIAAPQQYCPHVTLGLYRQFWNSKLILERIQHYHFQPFKIQVNQLTFGYYHAQTLQGYLYPYHRIQLGSLCCN